MPASRLKPPKASNDNGHSPGRATTKENLQFLEDKPKDPPAAKNEAAPESIAWFPVRAKLLPWLKILTHPQIKVLLVLLRYQNFNDGVASVGAGTIAKIIGGDASYVKRTIRRLKSLGFIITESGFNGGKTAALRRVVIPQAPGNSQTPGNTQTPGTHSTPDRGTARPPHRGSHRPPTGGRTVPPNESIELKQSITTSTTVPAAPAVDAVAVAVGVEEKAKTASDVLRQAGIVGGSVKAILAIVPNLTAECVTRAKLRVGPGATNPAGVLVGILKESGADIQADVDRDAAKRAEAERETQKTIAKMNRLIEEQIQDAIRRHDANPAQYADTQLDFPMSKMRLDELLTWDAGSCPGRGNGWEVVKGLDQRALKVWTYELRQKAKQNEQANRERMEELKRKREARELQQQQAAAAIEAERKAGADAKREAIQKFRDEFTADQWQVQVTAFYAKFPHCKRLYDGRDDMLIDAIRTTIRGGDMQRTEAKGAIE